MSRSTTAGIGFVCALSLVMFAALTEAGPNGQGANQQGLGAKSRRGGQQPQQLEASRIMQRFDQDGDAKLNTQELQQFLTMLQQRAQQGGKGKGKGGKAAAGRGNLGTDKGGGRGQKNGRGQKKR